MRQTLNDYTIDKIFFDVIATCPVEILIGCYFMILSLLATLLYNAPKEKIQEQIKKISEMTFTSTGLVNKAASRALTLKRANLYKDYCKRYNLKGTDYNTDLGVYLFLKSSKITPNTQMYISMDSYNQVYFKYKNQKTLL